MLSCWLFRRGNGRILAQPLMFVIMRSYSDLCEMVHGVLGMFDSVNSFYDNLVENVRARFYLSLEALLALAEELVHINLLCAYSGI